MVHFSCFPSAYRTFFFSQFLQDFSMQPPAQELTARDLHDSAWTFRHIYRGMIADLVLEMFYHFTGLCISVLPISGQGMA